MNFKSAQFAVTGVGGAYMAATAAMIAKRYILHVRNAKKAWNEK